MPAFAPAVNPASRFSDCIKNRPGLAPPCEPLPGHLLRFAGNLIVVDLSALELVRIIDVHGLPLGEEIDRCDGCFAVAVAGLLRATEGQMRLCANRRSVYVDSSGVQIARGLERAVHVARVDGS